MKSLTCISCQHCKSRGAACREGLCQPAGDCTKLLCFSNSNGSNVVLFPFSMPGAGWVPAKGIVPACDTQGGHWGSPWTMKYLLHGKWKSWCQCAAWELPLPAEPRTEPPKLSFPSFILSYFSLSFSRLNFLAGRHCLLWVFSFLSLPAHCLEQQLLTYFCLLIAAAIWILIPARVQMYWGCTAHARARPFISQASLSQPFESRDPLTFLKKYLKPSSRISLLSADGKCR